MSKFFSALTKVCIYSLVFLLPIFFLPFTVEQLEFNKIYLLFFLTSVGFLSWLANMVFNEKQLRFKRTPLDILVAIYLVVMVLSAIFSLDSNSSIFGSYGRFWPSLVGVLSLAAFYFLLTNNVTTKEDTAASEASTQISAGSLIKTMCFSALAAVLIGYGSLLGVWQWLGGFLSIIPPIMKIRIFSPVGGFFAEGYLLDSLELLCLFLAFVLPVAIGRFAFGLQYNDKTARMFTYFVIMPLLVLGLIMLAVVNFWPAWLALTAGLIVFLLVALKSRLFKQEINRLTPAVVLIGVALFFLLPTVFGFNNPLTTFLSKNQLLASLQNKFFLSSMPAGLNWQVAIQAVKENPVLGQGLGNFSAVFAKFKPGLYGQTRFDRASSFFAELVSTTGLLGFLAYLLLLAGCLALAWLFIKAKKNQAQAPKVVVKIGSQSITASKTELIGYNLAVAQTLPLIAGLVALVIAQVFYYQPLTLAFGFWVVLALLAVYLRAEKNERVFNFQEFPEVALVFNGVLVVVLIGIVLTALPLSQRYLADVNYRDYLMGQGKDVSKMEAAASLAGDEPVYHVLLAEVYLNRFNEEIGKQNPDSQVLSNMLLATRAEVRSAVAKAPNNASIQGAVAVIWRDLEKPAATLAAVTINNLQKALEVNPENTSLANEKVQVEALAKEFSEMPQKTFERAVALDPQNPSLYFELGKIKQQQNDLEGARVFYEKAVSINQAYLPPYLQLALVDEAESKNKEAQARLSAVLQQAPSWVEARFHLGRMYYNEKDYDQATKQFQAALQVFPNHSNSMYSLAKIYQKQGENSKALELFQKVLQLNPNNQEVQKEVTDLGGSISSDASGALEKSGEAKR
jgi:tetratricopeptide (TPR) repeat protein